MNEENKNTTSEENVQAEETTEAAKEKTVEEVQADYRKSLEAARRQLAEGQQAMAEGKGRLRLETPILAGDREIDELAYDFTALTGMEFVDAMDSDQSARNAYKITSRQALALFAKAAAKQTELVDMRDIQERIGMTDAVEAVQLATIFFNASTRAGQRRISKR